MKWYRSREGEATAVDTRTALTTLGSETAPGPILVPTGAKKLAGVITAACGSMAAATSYSSFFRIEGAGLPGGPETVAASSGGVPVATGGNAVSPARYIQLDVPVTQGNEVLIALEMAGTDVGQVSGGLTLVFSD